MSDTAAVADPASAPAKVSWGDEEEDPVSLPTEAEGLELIAKNSQKIAETFAGGDHQGGQRRRGDRRRGGEANKPEASKPGESKPGESKPEAAGKASKPEAAAAGRRNPGPHRNGPDGVFAAVARTRKLMSQLAQTASTLRSLPAKGFEHQASRYEDLIAKVNIELAAINARMTEVLRTPPH